MLTRRQRPSRRAKRVTIAMLVVLASCSPPNQEYDPELDARPGPITVHVKNENFLDMTVGVVVSGVVRRLGQVTGNGSANFTIAWSVANGTTIAVTAVPIGQNARFTSTGLSVAPGQMIDFRIAPVLRQSDAIVREP
ncbi:MAG TPA: hypothetical protein VH559_10080 [Gemmatimonadaceae bacterium]|jgi:hypothetical protein